MTQPDPRSPGTSASPGQPPRIQTVVWLSGTLNQVGGGERLALEGVKYFTSRGVSAHLVTWDYHPRALFDGRYSADNITVLAEPPLPGRGALTRTLRRATTLRALRSHLRLWRPDVIVCQSEYDCIVAWLATRGLGIPYAVEIFGQMFQFTADYAKYTLTFRKHLAEIRESRIGYRETVSMEPPHLSVTERVLQEVLAFARRKAVQGAVCIGTLSRQVQWEVGLLYERSTVVLKGAYSDDIFARRPPADLRRRLGVDGDIVLSVCRLVPKKRIHVLIQAFALIAERRPGAVLLIGGTGPEAEALRRRVKDLALESRVRFLGYVPEHDLYDYMAIADLCVSIDIADFDIAAFEPLALGTRALWSSEYEVDDELRNHPLLFTADPTPVAVADTMMRALTTPKPALSPALGTPLKAYTWTARFAKLHEALERAVLAANPERTTQT